MKRVFISLLMMLPLMAFSAVEINGIYYELDSYTKTAKVSRNMPGTYYDRREIVIPSSVNYNENDYRVVGIGKWAFDNAVNLTSITIPESVTYIEEDAFWNCSSLSSISIPSKVHSIYDEAFYQCSKLVSINIPKSVTYIGKGLFKGCVALESIVVEEGNPKYDSRNNCNAIIWETILIAGCKNTIIPNDVNIIDNSAFNNCFGLTSIEIPNSVLSIGDEAFAGCTGLTSIQIPNSVTRIGSQAFYGCTGLSYVVSLIENPFAIIGKNSGYSTFPLDVFNNVTLYVPGGTIEKYKSTEGWKDFVFIEEKIEKCATPTIAFKDGKFVFDCETEGVTFKYNITTSSVKSGEGAEVDFSPSYTISVYATKAGYENSETVTQEIKVDGSTPDVNGDGIVDTQDVLEIYKYIQEH